MRGDAIAWKLLTRAEGRAGNSILFTTPGRRNGAGQEPGDSVLLGARTLEALNVRVDPLRRELIDAGAAPAAAA
jgi:hypothetical protein